MRAVLLCLVALLQCTAAFVSPMPVQGRVASSSRSSSITMIVSHAHLRPPLSCACVPSTHGPACGRPYDGSARGQCRYTSC